MSVLFYVVSLCAVVQEFTLSSSRFKTCVIRRLELRYSITSVVLEWFRSYLCGSVQRVNKY